VRAKTLNAKFDSTAESDNTLPKQQVSWFWIIVSILLIITVIGAVLLYKIYLQKNSELKNIEHEKQETNAEKDSLANINGVKDRLISMIAHDIRSPLASVQNTLMLAREKIIDENEFLKLSQSLEIEIRNVTGMLDNMLLWSRERMMGIKINKTTFNLATAVEDIIALYRYNITNKNIEVLNLVAPETEVHTDKEIINTVLRNFLSNAIKFTLPGKKFIYSK